MAAVDLMPVVDVDSHLIEPADLWTSRVPAKFRDQAPHVVLDSKTGRRRWIVGKRPSFFVTELDHAGWKESYPGSPPDFSDADAGGWDPKARLAKLDEYGISAQVLFPNVIGFHSASFAEMDHDLSLACVRAYNDFQTEFTAVAPQRFIPLTFLPYWDVDASVIEMKRCKELGHKGVNLGVEMQRIGLPPLSDPQWSPLLAQAQDFDLPVNFHIGFSLRTAEDVENHMAGWRVDDLTWAKNVALQFMGNAGGIAEIIMSGVCHQYPRLNFVSIESGFGYVPFLLQALDWQFKGMDCGRLHPGWLLPSEYFRRQMYATFWFETGVGSQIELYPDNLMFETDYPHPTSLSPGPGSHAQTPQETIDANLADLSEEQRRKVLYQTAAKLYHLDI